MHPLTQLVTLCQTCICRVQNMLLLPPTLQRYEKKCTYPNYLYDNVSLVYELHLLHFFPHFIINSAICC